MSRERALASIERLWTTVRHCEAITHSGKPCKQPALRNYPRCHMHTNVATRAELGYEHAKAQLARGELLRAAPQCLRELPLWRLISRRMQLVLLAGWRSEVEQEVHGAWWAAVTRVLEWRQRLLATVPVAELRGGLRRPLVGTGGATVLPPQEPCLEGPETPDYTQG